MRFPYYKQMNKMDCGPTCLRMIAKYYGKYYNSETLRQQAGFNRLGVSLLGISETAENIGFRTRAVKISYDKLQRAPMPAIIHWNTNHFVVLISLTRRKSLVADPGIGIISFSTEDFIRHWQSNESNNEAMEGTALLLEPSHAFYNFDGEKHKKLDWGIITLYLKHSRWRLCQIFLSLFIGMVLQWFLPFLTQSMVDNGINTQNMQFITMILIAQLMITFSSSIVSFIRSRLQLRVSNSINISLLSDFWVKLTRLPVEYFSIHPIGDTMQRIKDNQQIQSFITGQAITIIFSFLNFIVYSIVLITYSIQLFSIFSIGNILYFVWIQLFLRFRRKINYQTFHLASMQNDATLQFVQGMQEIRLNNAEQLKRWNWENLQVKVFNLNFKNLNYGQWQSAGALFITQGKDICLSFLVAQMVVKGQLTFGTMLAVQYIIGQLSGPIQDFIGLVQNIQDAKISMERLNEIHEMQDEEPMGKTLINLLPSNKNIRFNKITFAYPGHGNESVLEDISLEIEQGKVTAIVGLSGSGKTTLLKLLLKIYGQYQGELKVGESNFKFISPSFWRKQCGAVLQDSFIFNDTIARNIAVGDEYIDTDKLLESCRIANVSSFIDQLANGFDTKLGENGTGLSQGQRQRLLIARAIYKNPQYLFFDEATNALDASNEKTIVENLQQFFKGKTVVIVAHRLSTVRDADKIFVLHKGKIVEEGAHNDLVLLKGHYYELIKNQMDIDK